MKLPRSLTSLLRTALTVILLAWAGAALAIPPLLPPPAENAVIKAYMKAITDNDLEAYGKLFAPGVIIVSDWPKATSRAAWLKAMTREFSPARRARFPAVFTGYINTPQPGYRVLLVEETRACSPRIAECFTWFRTEILTLRDGLIVGLERSGYQHGMTQSGEWTLNGPLAEGEVRHFPR